MSFLNFPDEVIIQVIEHTTLTAPRSFESLLLTCTRIYSIGQEFIAEHNILQRRWRRFRFDKDIRNSQQLLAKIAENPLVALHIDDVDLTYDQATTPIYNALEWNTWRQYLNDHGDPAALYTRLERMLASQPPSSPSIDVLCAAWHRLLRFERHSKSMLPTLFLLSLLENVRHVRLPKRWTETMDYRVYSPKYYSMLRASDILAGRLFPPASASGDQQQHPHRVCVTQAYSGPEAPFEWIGLQVLSPLLLLPGLTELRASSCISSARFSRYKPFRWDERSLWCSSSSLDDDNDPYTNNNHDNNHEGPPPRTSTLETLILTTSSLLPADLSPLLRACPRLTALRYSHSTKYPHTRWDAERAKLAEHPDGTGSDMRDGVDFDAPAFLDVLAREAGKRLTFVSVTVAGPLDGFCWGGVRSLRGFERVEGLEVDVRAFATSSSSSGGGWSWGWGWAWAIDLFVGNKEARLSARPPNLLQILPPSVKKVRLIADAPTQERDVSTLKNLFHGVDKGTLATTLPLLEELRVTRMVDPDPAPFAEHYDRHWRLVSKYAAMWRTVCKIVRAAGGVYDEEEREVPDPSRFSRYVGRERQALQ